MSENILTKALEAAVAYRKELPNLAIAPSNDIDADQLLKLIDEPLPQNGESEEKVLGDLINFVEKGRINSTSGRYFGFVIGGSTPMSIASDWMTSVWDQSAFVYNTSPASAVIEDVVAKWMLKLLDLPGKSSIGFLTGGQMANFTALSVAQNTQLEQAGWNVDENGLQGAPQIHIFCGEHCHGTILSAIRMTGLGKRNIIPIQTDDHGRMIPDDLANKIRKYDGPKIICSQAGNVNTGAFDPFKEISNIAHDSNAWHHVDGAFGLWARVSDKYKHLTDAVEMADSWGIDAHKWLNVPHESGMVIIKHPERHKNLKRTRCAYAGEEKESRRDPTQWVPENSRRARGFVLFSTMKNLGQSGIVDMIENSCEMAQLFATKLGAHPHLLVINKVFINQVIFRFQPPETEDLDAFNQSIANRVQAEGVCWLGTSAWQNKTVLRISVSNYLTNAMDVQKSVESIFRSYECER